MLIRLQAKFAERKEPLIFEAFKKNNKAYIDDRYNVSKLLEVLLVRSISAAMKQSPNGMTPRVTITSSILHESV